MTITSMLLRLGLALLVGYVLGPRAHAADLDNDGPKIDLTPPPLVAALASLDTTASAPTISTQAPPLPAEDQPTLPERIAVPKATATTAPATAAEPAPAATTATPEPATPAAPVAPVQNKPASVPSESTVPAAVPAHEPASKVSVATATPASEPDNTAALARESVVLQAAEKKLLEREAQIVDPIRELLLREASLIAQATENPEKKTASSTPPVPQYDRVTTAERLVLTHDFRMAKVLLRSIDTSSGVTEEERAKAALLLAKIDLYEGKSSDAVVKLGAWLSEFPRRRESPFVYYLLGQAYRDLGVYELARENFYRVMSGTLMSVANSDDSNYSNEKRLVRAAVWQLAETEYMHQNWERAQTYFERFYTQNPSGDQLVEASLFRKADCQYQMRHLPEATSGYEKALAVAPFHPFAPEAWLRLYFLYGSNNQPKKQQEAMQALTWLVKNLQPNRLAYWQQRAVSMMMEMPLENRTQLVSLRDGLRTRAEDPNWKTLYAQLDDLCSRLTLERPDHTVMPTAGAPQSADEWAKWKTDYTHKRDQIQEQAKQLLQRQPVNDTVKPRSGVPTQG